MRAIDSARVAALVIVLQVRMPAERNEKRETMIINHMFTFAFNETIKKVALTESENVYDPVHSLRSRCSKYRDHQTRRLGFRRMSTAQPTSVDCVVFYPKFRGIS